MANAVDDSGQRVVFAQFTNPANYPPIMNAATLALRAGMDVVLIGALSDSDHGLKLPTELAARAKWVRLPQRGLQQKFAYVRFVWRAMAECRGERAWLYASDHWASVAAVLGRWLFGARVVYHEHDFHEPGGWFQRLIARMRRAAVRNCDLLVVPNQQRLAAARQESGRADRASVVVWNCPLREEVASARAATSDGRRAYYHGSLSPRRIPEALFEALQELQPAPTLTILGYQTEPGQLDRNRTLAAKYHVNDLVEVHPPLSRPQALVECARHDIGICHFEGAGDHNLACIAGASNKPFDYLANGLVLLIDDNSQWRELLSETGTAVFVDFGSARSVREGLEAAGALARTPGTSDVARSLVRDRWNYETQFAPVLRLMTGRA